MAGLGRKVFTAGEVLTAADVNGYLMDQAVQVYAGTAARGSALGTSVSEGQVTYRTDDNALEVYDGSAWIPVGAATTPNAIINGAFDFWQRGTSFTNNATGSFNTDRWKQFFDGTGATRIISQQTFTPGTAPVAGYEGTFFARFNQSVAGSGGTFNTFTHPIEDVRTFAGQTVTLSYFAKAAATLSLTIEADQSFGSGGSATVTTSVVSGQSISTSWTRYTHTFTMPAISGKTIGTSSFINLSYKLPLNTTFTFDIWGVQLEAGSVATPFRRNSNSLQGELAACQRYYFRNTTAQTYGFFAGSGLAISTTVARFSVPFPVQMRTRPSSIEVGGALGAYDGNNYQTTGTWTLTGDTGTPLSQGVDYTHGSGVFTQYRPALIGANNNINTYIGFSAEL